MKASKFVLILAVILFGSPALSDELYVRVVDTGGGLCTVTAAPGRDGGPSAFMIYDAGHWNGQECVNAVRELVPESRKITLFVVSHSDGDHLGQANDILKLYAVETFLRTGFERTVNRQGVAFARVIAALCLTS